MKLRDNLIVYGFNCTWWDDISMVDTLLSKDDSPGGIPCCPYCKGVLFQIDEKDWFKGIHKHTQENPLYANITSWSRGKCFKTPEEVAVAYNKTILEED